MTRPWNWSPRAKKIDADAAVTAVVAGAGAELDEVADAVAASLQHVSGRSTTTALAYPNAEVVRKLLVNVLPADAVVLVPHEHFGMDLGPGPVHQAGFGLSSPTWWDSRAWTATA